MNCPNCDKKTNVIDSRRIETIVFRVRVCSHCKTKFYTEETEIDIDEADEYMAELQRRYRSRAKTKKPVL